MAGRPKRRAGEPTLGKPRKIGAPEKLTPELRETITRYIRQGSFRETACAAAGVTAKTLREWLRRGKDESDQGLRTKYTDLVEAMDKAEAECVVRDVAKIRAAGEDDWKALAWVLERRNRDLFGLKQEHKHEIGGTLADFTLLALGKGSGDGESDR